METGGWSLGADKAATQLIGRPSKYLTSVKNFNMNYPRKQGNTQPCGNYESAFWPILKVHNFYMSVSLKIQTHNYLLSWPQFGFPVPGSPRGPARKISYCLPHKIASHLKPAGNIRLTSSLLPSHSCSLPGNHLLQPRHLSPSEKFLLPFFI